MSIPDLITEFFSQPYNKLTEGGTIYVRDVQILTQILDGTFEGDVLIFNNLGRKPFEIMINTEQFPDQVALMFEYLISRDEEHYVFAYRIGETEKVLSVDFSPGYLALPMSTKEIDQ